VLRCRMAKRVERELHIRLPEALFDKIARQREVLRKKDPMANLSDAARALLEAAPNPR
jgi:hypothetical protein